LQEDRERFKKMIAIRLVAQAGGVPATPLAAVFGEAGGDIGRAADCTLVLPDPERLISRKHLQVACREGRYFLRLISANLLVELDGVPLTPGVESVLEVGAQIRVGPFVLEAGSPAPAQPRQAPAVAGPAAVSAPIDDDAFGLLDAPQPAARPSVFHDLLHAAPVERRSRPRADLASQEVDLLVGDPTGEGLREPVAGPGEVSAATLIDALYAGLGIAAPPPEARSAAQMELIGALLRAAVSGTLGLLAARGIAKRELGASQTMIQTRQNNPLKFAADVNAALLQLLEPPLHGFIPALPAVRETFDDLAAHEVAILAGMRAALEAVLARFDPEALEQRWADKGVWDNLRLANHKAKMWERYSEQHAEIVREIEDNFDAVFAGAFRVAYEAQRARLTRQGRDS
jgi:predicted component of type VI protein secretion system